MSFVNYIAAVNPPCPMRKLATSVLALCLFSGCSNFHLDRGGPSARTVVFPGDRDQRLQERAAQFEGRGFSSDAARRAASRSEPMAVDEYSDNLINVLTGHSGGK